MRALAASAHRRSCPTKQHDVLVRPQDGRRDSAIDLLVEIRKDGKSTLRFFGVQMVGSIDLPDIPEADGPLLSPFGMDTLEANLPICVFVIGVRKPEGIYRWLVEPVVEGGRAALHQAGEADWRPLDEAGADRLIGQVNAWYDAFHKDAPPRKHARHSTTES